MRVGDFTGVVSGCPLWQPQPAWLTHRRLNAPCHSTPLSLDAMLFFPLGDVPSGFLSSFMTLLQSGGWQGRAFDW